MLRRLVLCFLLALPLAACGNKGPLVKAPAKAATPAAETVPAAPAQPAPAVED